MGRLLKHQLLSTHLSPSSEFRHLLDSLILLDFLMMLIRSVSTVSVMLSSSTDVSVSLLSSETSSPVRDTIFPEPSTRQEPPLTPSLMVMLQFRQCLVLD